MGAGLSVHTHPPGAVRPEAVHAPGFQPPPARQHLASRPGAGPAAPGCGPARRPTATLRGPADRVGRCTVARSAGRCTVRRLAPGPAARVLPAPRTPATTGVRHRAGG